MKTSLIVGIEYNTREQMWQAEVFDDTVFTTDNYLFYYMGSDYLDVIEHVTTFLKGVNNSG